MILDTIDPHLFFLTFVIIWIQTNHRLIIKLQNVLKNECHDFRYGQLYREINDNGYGIGNPKEHSTVT